LAEARIGYWEYSGDLIALYIAYTGQGGYRLGVLLGGGGRRSKGSVTPRGGRERGEGRYCFKGGVYSSY